MSKEDDFFSIKQINKFLDQFEKMAQEDEMFKNRLQKILNHILNKQSQKQVVADDINEPTTNSIEKIIYKDKIIYQDKIIEKRVEVPIEKIVEKKVEIVPNWAQSLESENRFLQQVQGCKELKKILLPQHDDHMLQLIVMGSQWGNILRIWDALATQVKNTQYAISETEKNVLEHCLALFNLSLQSNQASLRNPELGESYDYDIHHKITGSGGAIDQVLLAGLYNAAGESVRAAIVTTR